MDRFGFVIAVVLAAFLTAGHAKQAYFEFANDPHYPQLVTVSNVQYQLVNNKFLEFSGVVTVYEELNEGTNVSTDRLESYISVMDLSYGLNVFIRVVFSSAVESECVARLPICSSAEQCRCEYVHILPQRIAHLRPVSGSIRPGVYTINNMQIDLDRWPLLWRGFNTAASITLHKNGRILSKWDIKCSVTP